MATKETLSSCKLYVLTLALIVTTSPVVVTAQTGPVDFYDCTGKPDGNYVHTFDCSKFIACVAGTYAFEFDCVTGLHYDPVNDRCDWPEVVGCVTDPPSTTQTTTTSTTTEPSTLMTNLTTSTTPTTSAPTSRPPVFDCFGLEDGNYKHPTDCSKFISCVAGEHAYEMDCPAGLHYDPTTDRCDYPEVVGCDLQYTSTSTDSPSPSTSPTSPTNATTSESTTTNTTISTTSLPTPIFNCSGLQDGNYKHPTDCSKFVSCVAGEHAYEMDCPAGLHYDPTTDRCDYPEVVGCEINTTTTTLSSTVLSSTQGVTTDDMGSSETTLTTTWSPSPSTNTTADPDACNHDCQYVRIDCHNYYTCINFTRKEYHQCSYELGLAFNPEVLVCDRIDNVIGCGGESTTELPTTPENECGCEYKPHETDCSKFYFCSDSCSNSSCQLLSCPGNLLWSVDMYGDGSSHQQCTLPELATCASKDSGSTHLEFSCHKKDNGFYRNERDCHSYWKCSNRVALLYTCPQDFIYNPEIKACDFPGKSLRFCKN